MSRPKLLCVDDEVSILHSLERVFKDQFAVLTSDSPVAALDLLRANADCAIVLSDYRMPGMNGVEFLRHARTLAPLTSRAILSGQIDLSQISDAINNGDIHKFFLKPWENDYLALQMQEALQMHRTLREKAHYEQLAITDPVTQLTNHRFFQDQLRLELRKAEDAKQPLSLIIVDVDHFKGFNDRFGHPEGDRLLFKVASFLQDHVKNRGYVSRYGGEEFTVILPGYPLEEARQFANEVRAKFERTSLAGPTSSPAFVTVSSGLASFPQHGTNAADLIEAADKALYQAKRQGRNQVAIAGAPKHR
jgi:diguanylate cyclase (GGDEF)-like protein